MNKDTFEYTGWTTQNSTDNEQNIIITIAPRTLWLIQNALRSECEHSDNYSHIERLVKILLLTERAEKLFEENRNTEEDE